MAFKGLDKHLRRLKRLQSDEVVRLANQVVYEGADTIRAEASRLITTGAVSGKNHVASKPGQPPNEDTGTLRIHTTVAQTDILKAQVRSDAPYAGALEFGTSKMAARPFMRPARDKKKKEVRDRMVKQMNTLVKRSG